MSYNPQSPMECRRRIAWTIACERAVVTKEDAVEIYKNLMQKFLDTDKKQQYKKTESNKT